MRGQPDDLGRSGGAPADGFSSPTYHSAHPSPPPEPALAGGPADHPSEKGAAQRRQAFARPPGTGNLTVTRAVLARSRYFSKLVAHKVVSASEADGAKESGLTAMIWNQVMSYGADAMITVALAGTVFFSAPGDQQKGNVLLYLLMTVAPFALVAPVIGPALDRVQHGRRVVFALTAFGRAALAAVMAMHFTDLYILFPSALGSLVLSKAYSVIRSTAAPRLVPSTMTLVEANARLSIFGLAAALIGGAIVGVAIKITGSYPFGLWITAIAFVVTGWYGLRLPKIVDSLPPDVHSRADRSHPAADRTGRADSPRPVPTAKRGLGGRILDWASRGFTAPVILALQGGSALRWLAGLLTLFLAFYIEAVSHGWEAVANLGAMGGAFGVGNFVGTGIGTRLKMGRPDLIIVFCNALAAVGCILAAALFTLPLAILAALLTAIANSLGKLSLDAVVQRDVAESLRSSAFGRSETFLQLAWVLGAAIALLLPSHNGRLGLSVAGGVMAVVTLSMAARSRVTRPPGERATGRRRPEPA
jgi:MFS family permease